MKLKAILLLSLLGVASSAFADAPPAGGPPPPVAAMPGMPGTMPGGAPPVMFRAGGIGTIGFVAFDLMSIGIAYLPIDHMMVAAAVSLQYNDNVGTPVAGVFVGPPSHAVVDPTSNLESGILVAVEYMIKDAMPFAMGPALAVRTNFAPINAFGAGIPAFGQWILMPSWDLWYAPWNAPLAIGAAIGLSITLQKGYNPVITFATPSMRLAYTF